MKFKPMVVSLIMLGVITPTLAASNTHHVYARKSQALVQDMEANEASPIRNEGWFNHLSNNISIGGMGSIVGAVGNHDYAGSFSGLGSGSDLYINNANLLVGAELSKNARVDMNFAVKGGPNIANMVSSTNVDRITNSYDYRVFIDEVYATFASSKYPLFVKVGKMYVPFGDYKDKYVPWQIESPAQMLAQNNDIAGVFGVAFDQGVYASVYALKGDVYPIGSTTNNIRNWGAQLGYRNALSCLNMPNTHFNVNAGYVRNVWDSDAFSPDTNNSTAVASGAGRNNVGGLSLHADLTHDAFSIYADWVGALINMAPTYQNIPAASLTAGSSKFWGANVNAAYAFNTLGHDSSFEVGYQFSGNGNWFAVNDLNADTPTTGGAFDLVVPKWRILGEYKINLLKHTDLGLVFAHSKSYELGYVNSQSRDANVGLARLGFKF